MCRKSHACSDLHTCTASCAETARFPGVFAPLEHVRRRVGSHAGTGALIGGLIDLACVVAGVIVVGTAMSNMHGSLIGGNWGSFSGGW